MTIHYSPITCAALLIALVAVGSGCQKKATSTTTDGGSEPGATTETTKVADPNRIYGVDEVIELLDNDQQEPHKLTIYKLNIDAQMYEVEFPYEEGGDTLLRAVDAITPRGTTLVTGMSWFEAMEYHDNYVVFTTAYEGPQTTYRMGNLDWWDYQYRYIDPAVIDGGKIKLYDEEGNVAWLRKIHTAANLIDPAPFVLPDHDYYAFVANDTIYWQDGQRFAPYGEEAEQPIDRLFRFDYYSQDCLFDAHGELARIGETRVINESGDCYGLVYISGEEALFMEYQERFYYLEEKR